MHSRKIFQSLISPSSRGRRRGFISKQGITLIAILETNERTSSALNEVPTLSTQNTALLNICLAAATLTLADTDLPTTRGPRNRRAELCC